MRQGQGSGTGRKENTFSYAFKVNRSLSHCLTNRFPYWHLDMNAGSGWNEKANCKGSPLVFLDHFQGTNYRAYFCDSNQHSIRKLEETILREFPSEWEKCRFLSIDNRHGIELFLIDLLQSGENLQYSIGSVLSDPNGNVRGANYESIAEFAGRCPRVDIMLNWNHGSYLRTSASPVHTLERHNWNLLDVSGMIGRPCWHIRNPITSGTSRFIITIGRNKRTRPSSAAGWFDLETDEGKRIALHGEQGQPCLFSI